MRERLTDAPELEGEALFEDLLAPGSHTRGPAAREAVGGSGGPPSSAGLEKSQYMQSNLDRGEMRTLPMATTVHRGLLSGSIEI